MTARAAAQPPSPHIANDAERIEPGLISVFRLFVGVELALQALVVYFLARGHMLQLNVSTVLILAQLLLLFAYLFARPAQRALGAAYVPLALWVATVGPIVWEAVGTVVRIRLGLRGSSALGDASDLYVWLLLPLLLISVQYRIRTLLLFTAGTSLLSVLLPGLLAHAGGFSLGGVVTGAITRFLLYTAAGLVIVQLSKAQRAYRREQAQQREQLARYALTLEQLTISRERNRLARDLHDTLAHTLSAISVQLTAIDAVWEADAANAHQMLTQTQELTRAGLDEARRALHALRASPVAALGVTLAIRQTAERAAARGGFALIFTAPPGNIALPAEVEQQLYRVADEAVANIARHAHARHAWVTLAVDARPVAAKPQSGRRLLTLTVQDDGVGFDTTRPPADGHFGLAGLRERALLLNATLDVASAPGAGTLLRLTLPY